MTIQHNDVNIGPGHYSFLSKEELLVTKIFYTIQGEGPYAGTPAVFVRLAGCNRGDKTSMGCAFCDTDFRFSNGVGKNFDTIVLEMQQVAPKRLPLPLVVITGGEPMLQDNIVPFITMLHKSGFIEIQIESNGDRLARGFTGDRYCNLVDLVVSPKTAHGSYKAISNEVGSRVNALKFLIEDNPTSPYHDIPDWAWINGDDIDRTQIYLQPITVYQREITAGKVLMWVGDGGIDYAQTGLNYRRAAQLAMTKNARISMQQHLFLEVE